jgi:hypothetical protein
VTCSLTGPPHGNFGADFLLRLAGRVLCPVVLVAAAGSGDHGKPAEHANTAMQAVPGALP